MCTILVLFDELNDAICYEISPVDKTKVIKGMVWATILADVSVTYICLLLFNKI